MQPHPPNLNATPPVNLTFTFSSYLINQGPKTARAGIAGTERARALATTATKTTRGRRKAATRKRSVAIKRCVCVFTCIFYVCFKGNNNTTVSKPNQPNH